MHKSILIGLMAAILVPGAADARERGHDRDRRAEARNDGHDRQQARRHHRGWVAYSAPYRGWSYRPVTVGYQLRPAFYGSRYFISDYGAYRLRAPGRYQRWIRYGDDLLLVNVRTGRVLQVIPGRYY
jgi:Ni/Co efflux regulator RcnB